MAQQFDADLPWVTTVTYTTVAGDVYSSLNVVELDLSPDDEINEHVMADSVVYQVRESDLADAGLEGNPARGDIITRELTLSSIQEFEVVSMRRDQFGGVWNLFCQQRIRVTP